MGNCSSTEDKTPAMKMHEKRTLREKEQRAAGEQPRNSLAFGTSVYNGNGSSMRVSHRRPSASPQQQPGSMTSYASSRRLSAQRRLSERYDDTSCTCSEIPPSEHPVVFADTSTNNNPVKASPSGASTTPTSPLCEAPSPDLSSNHVTSPTIRSSMKSPGLAPSTACGPRRRTTFGGAQNGELLLPTDRLDNGGKMLDNIEEKVSDGGSEVSSDSEDEATVTSEPVSRRGSECKLSNGVGRTSPRSKASATLGDLRRGPSVDARKPPMSRNPSALSMSSLPLRRSSTSASIDRKGSNNSVGFARQRRASKPVYL